MHEDNTKSGKVIISSIALSSLLLLLCGCKSHKKNERLTENNTINSNINSTIKDDALYVNLNNSDEYTGLSDYTHPAMDINNIEYYNKLSTLNKNPAILPEKISIKKRTREKKYLGNRKNY